jgi:hypothetical protein
MGFLKSVFKGIKKVVKKIGKGIKKIAGKVFGALGKIGPLGQLALMFIGIPPVLGKMMGTVGSFVQSVAPNMFNAFKAIKTAGQGVFNTITEAIGNGVDRVMNFTQGKGFNLSEGRTSIFGNKSDVDLTKITEATIDTGEVSAQFKPTTTEDRLAGAIKDAPSKDLLSPDIPDIKLPDNRTFGQKIVDYGTDTLKGIKTSLSDPGKLAGDAISGGIKSGLGSGISGKITKGIMGDAPTIGYVDMGQFMTPTTQQRLLDSTTWNGITTAYQRAGSFGGAAAGDLLGAYFNNTFSPDTQYQQDMRRLGAYVAQ